MTNEKPPETVFIAQNLSQFSRYLALMFILILSAGMAFYFYVQAEEQSDKANQLRLQSFLLADELRQSSDDLTQMVRSYVITGDAVYKDYFYEILAIRDGTKPRPLDYRHDYWALAQKNAPRPNPDGATVVLLTLMKQTGFSDAEFNWLEQAKINSDALTQTELTAMALIEGKQPVSDSVRLKASTMLFDDTYRQAKANIMQPIGQLAKQVEQRTNEAVQHAEKTALALRYLFIMLSLLLLATVRLLYKALQSLLGCSIIELHQHLEQLGLGDFSKTIVVKAKQENSILAWVSKTQQNLKQTEEALIKTQFDLQEAQRVARLGSWSWDVASDTIKWSDELYRLYARNKLIPLPCYEERLKFFTPESAKVINAAMQNAIKTGKSYQVDLELNQAIGAGRWVMARGEAVYDTQWQIISLRGTVQDITERKQAEQQLRLSEQKFRQLIEQAPLPLCFVNNKEEIEYVNNSFSDIFGYTAEEIPTLKEWWLLLYPDSNYRQWVLQTWNLAVERSISQGRSIESIEYKLTCKDGSVRIMIISGIVFPEGFLATFVDITERKQAEQQLRESEAFTNSILNSLSAHIAVLDANGSIITVNEAWQKFGDENGLPKSCNHELKHSYFEQCQKSFQESQLEDAIKVQHGIMAVLAGTQKNFELEYPCHSPTEQHWFCMRVTALSGKNQGVVVSHENTTQRKKMEEALKISEAQFRAIIQISPIPLALNDNRQNIVFLNNAFVQTFGYDLTDIPTLSHWRSKAYPDPVYRQQVSDTWQASLNEHQLFAPLELDICCKNGTVKTVLVNASAILDSFEFVHLVMLYDISERKQIEAELTRSNAELGQFAYAVSHDMRQPLRMVSSYLALIESALAGKLDEETRQCLDFALNGAKRMDAMILSLLEYSRIGRVCEDKTRLSSKVALDEALAFLQPEISACGGAVKVSGEWPELLASPDELTRLLQNLIGNALKYCREGQPPVVDVYGEVRGTVLRVAVRDQGIGIDPSQINRLFKVFSRLQARSRFEGTGVGLALCRKIVEHHGGSIGVESAGEGQGCVFWFELPLLDVHNMASKLDL